MATTIMIFKVKDYDHWRSVYDAQAKLGEKAGRQSETVYRSPDDPNDLALIGTFDTAAGFRSLVESEELRTVMAEAGVQGMPVTHIID